MQHGEGRTNFAKTMLRSYESGYATLKPMAEKYGHYAWAATLVETTNFYESEIAKYQALLGGVATKAEITATHQTFKYNEHQQVTETPEVASRSSSEDEVTEDYTVNVYEDVVITHTKTVTTKTYKGTFTTQWYSDDSNETSVSTELVSTVVEDVTRTETERNFVKTYELERPVEVVVVEEEPVVEEVVVVVEEPVVVVEEPVVVVNVNDGMGVVTENVFTVEEYLAMSDVNLSTTQTYIDAVHTMNPNINLDYIIPKEGAVIWFDNMYIPEDAPHRENAYLILNYMLRPEVIAASSNYIGYANANKSATPLVDPSLTADTAIYPDKKTLLRLQTTEVLAPKEERKRSRTWTKIKTGL
jgi:hypothetical protein